MSEANDIAYLELWRDRVGSRTATVAVRFDGSRSWDTHLDWGSDRELDWLREEGFVFQRLLSPGRSTTAGQQSVFA